jgi:hypothetical protein
VGLVETPRAFDILRPAIGCLLVQMEGEERRAETNVDRLNTSRKRAAEEQEGHNTAKRVRDEPSDGSGSIQ